MPTPSPLIPGTLLTTSLVAVYTAPLNHPSIRQVQLSTIRFVNTNATDVTVTLHVVPAGGATSDANARFKTMVVTPSADGTPSLPFTLDDILLPGWSIYASASVGNVVALSANGILFP